MKAGIDRTFGVLLAGLGIRIGPAPRGFAHGTTVSPTKRVSHVSWDPDPPRLAAPSRGRLDKHAADGGRRLKAVVAITRGGMAPAG